MLIALGHLDVLDPTDTYWAGRLTLCGDPADLDRYDAAFAAYFGGRDLPLARRPPPAVRLRPASIAIDVPAGEGTDDAAMRRTWLRRRAGSEVLRHRDVTKLSATERDEVRRLLDLLSPRVGAAPHAALRAGAARARSTSSARCGACCTRAASRAGWPAAPVGASRASSCCSSTSSGSMEPYSDALLRFSHAAVRAAPVRVEVFTLGTRLTRITRELRKRDPDGALAAASGAIPDWSGGTRLGDSMKAFLDLWGQRGVARGAIVVLFSDGWERGDPTLLGDQMTRLARLSHSVVWVNPHKGKDGYSPVTGGMIAALPHIDHLVAGHSLAALERLAEVIGEA